MPQSPRRAAPCCSAMATWLHTPRTSSQHWLTTSSPALCFTFRTATEYLVLFPLSLPHCTFSHSSGLKEIEEPEILSFLALGLNFLSKVHSPQPRLTLNQQLYSFYWRCLHRRGPLYLLVGFIVPDQDCKTEAIIFIYLKNCSTNIY